MFRRLVPVTIDVEQRMKVAVFQHTLNPTVLGWVRGLERAGHQVLNVIAYDTEPIGGWPDDLQVAILPNTSWRTNRIMRRLRPSMRKATYAFASIRSVRHLLVVQRIDVVIVKLYSLRNVIVLLSALLCRVRRVAWIEGTAPPARKWRLLRTLGVVPHRWFVTNHHHPGGVVESSPSSRTDVPVITYAPEPVQTIPLTRETAPPVRVLVVSAFWDVDAKRPGWVLEAAHRSGVLDGRAQFSFVGAGNEPSAVLDALRARTEELDVRHLVDIRVNVPFVEMSAIYAEHDLLVLPSLREQFGMAVPEAMANGLAVIISDAVGARGLVVPGRNGLVFRVDDLDELSDALRQLVDDPALTRRVGAAGRALIAEHASAELTASAILGLISRARRGAGTRQRR